MSYWPTFQFPKKARETTLARGTVTPAPVSVSDPEHEVHREGGLGGEDLCRIRGGS